MSRRRGREERGREERGSGERGSGERLGASRVRHLALLKLLRLLLKAFDTSDIKSYERVRVPEQLWGTCLFGLESIKLV